MTVVSGFDLFGGGVKSVQSGQTTLNAQTLDIAINQVDSSKSIIIVNIQPTRGSDWSYSLVNGKVLNDTTIRLIREFNGTTGAPVVSWQVIEFENVKSLQKGDFTLSTGNSEVLVPINTVNLNKTMVICSQSTTETASELWTAFLKYRLVNNSNIGFYTIRTNKVIHWQVVEFE